MRYLGMQKHSHQYWLDLMNQSKYKTSENDSYNQGPLVSELEHRVSKLLGKPKAMFFNKGTTCQLAALKTICVTKNNKQIILHPQSHIALDEQDAYSHLMGLSAILIGAQNKPFTLQEIKNINTDVATLVLELPLRRAGFKLTQWNELLKIRQWCNDHQVHFHMDGARLWESTHYYQKSLAEISSLFDSVYVSLYKGIGGMSGALLAGPENLIQASKIWRNRLGSNMYCTFPALITGLEGLDNNLAHIHSWVERAHEIAKSLEYVKGLEREQPHTNGFQIRINAEKHSMNQKLKVTEQKHQMVLCKPFENTTNQEAIYTEIQVGPNHQQISNSEIVDFFNALIDS